LLTPGQDSDYLQAEALLGEDKPLAVVADKGYDGSGLVQAIEERGAKAVIPSRSNAVKPRLIDWNLYKDRNKIERYFNKIKHYRRVATRFDKTAVSFLAFLHLTATMILLK
jgi:transposase